MRKGVNYPLYALMLVSGAFMLSSCGYSNPPPYGSVNLTGDPQPLNEGDEEPADLDELQTYDTEEEIKEEGGMPFDIRQEAIKEAAISFGARGGLAKRSWEIREELKVRGRHLDKIYNFRELLIAAPSGFMIEPPVITESMNAMLIEPSGQAAAVSDKIYNIIHNAQIVSAPKNWRTYLEREWGEVVPPPAILLPQTEEERELWRENVAIGWKIGYEQADEIFAEDLAKMTSDFEGMVRYRMLLAQGMVSPPYALQIDRGITGGGEEMRVGDRAVQITGVPELVTGADQWKPANR